jgi:hypothetical protein
VADGLAHLAVLNCFAVNSIVIVGKVATKGSDSEWSMYRSNTRTFRAFSTAVEITTKELVILIKALQQLAV